jgi:hypothetical protein
MIIEVLQALYFLSNCFDQKNEIDILKKKLKFLKDPLLQWVESYAETYDTQGAFPIFETFISTTPGATEYLLEQGIGPEVLAAFTKENIGQYSQNWHRHLNNFEVKYLEIQLMSAGSGDEKLKIAKKIQALLVRTTSTHESVLKASSISIVGDLRKRTEEKGDGILWPIERLNENVGLLQPGMVASILGCPSTGKTTFAQNVVYLNSFKSNKRTLYFYLEDIPVRYEMNLMSLFSRELPDKSLWIPSHLLKRGFDKNRVPDIEKLEATIEKVQRLYDSERKGEVIYQSMNGFSNDPIIFGPELAEYCDKWEIDLLVVDHLVRFGGFRHPDYPRYEYLSLMMGCIANVAIGQYGNRMLVAMPLAQPNREGEARAIRTKGHFNLYDTGDVPAVEKDSMILIGVHSDEAMRQANAINTIVLKARDGGADSEPHCSYFDPPYALISTSSNMGEGGLRSSYDLDQLFDNLDVTSMKALDQF